VNTRNISQLLNIISSCSITEFKDAGLEYICLQLECMLENHLLDDLNEDLLFELNAVVRGNQLNCLPFAKSGRAELLLLEHHPSLVGEIGDERERRIRDMAFRETLKDDDNRLSSSYRARIGSLDDVMSSSPSQDKAKRKSKTSRNAPFSPTIRPKDSTVDLMFDMDDEDTLTSKLPTSPNPMATSDEMSPANTSLACIPAVCVGDSLTSQNQALSPNRPKSAGSSLQNVGTPPPTPVTKTWSSPILTPTKLGMKEIMAQASATRTSNLSMSLSAQNTKEAAGATTPPQKLSQKERKKQQQQAAAQYQIAKTEADVKSSSPWQLASKGTKTSLKDVLSESKPSPSATPTLPLDLPVPTRSLSPRRTASPDTRFAGQARTMSTTSKGHPSAPHRSWNASQPPSKSPMVPHSKSYLSATPKAEPSLQLSMADIIGQQKREREVIKEAVAKRSLQEIQEEQAFQEWWDQESRRAQEEEASRARGSSSAAAKSSKASYGRGKGSARGRGGRGGARRGRGQEGDIGGA
jgi:hypothetical protein